MAQGYYDKLGPLWTDNGLGIWALDIPDYQFTVYKLVGNHWQEVVAAPGGSSQLVGKLAQATGYYVGPIYSWEEGVPSVEAWGIYGVETAYRYNYPNDGRVDCPDPRDAYFKHWLLVWTADGTWVGIYSTSPCEPKIDF